MNVHIGKRGLVLLMFGGVWVFIGLGTRTLSQSHALPLYHSIPIGWLAWAWILTGALACLLALTSRDEWRGYPVLFPMPFLQAVGYGAGFFTDHLPVAGVAVWGLLVGILVVISDWPEPPALHSDAEL